MINRKNWGGRTDKLKNYQDNCYEIAMVGNEYFSPKQHGGIYGTVYRQYFTTTLPADLTSGNNVSKLLDYTIIALGGGNRHVLRGFASDGGSVESYIHLTGTSGNNNLLLVVTGVFSSPEGWVEYTK